MTNVQNATPSRPEIRKIFKRNFGAAMAVAKALDISHVSVSLWLKGKTTSARVAEACEAKALELLAEEGASK